MNFISLSGVLAESTAAYQAAQAAPDEKDALSVYQDALSHAAADLHARLHNAIEPLRWVELDAETGRALYSDTVAAEGLAILKHKAGQSRRDTDAYFQHVHACNACGLDPATEPQPYSMEDLRKFPLFRANEIGFDHDELSAFLGPEDAATEEPPQSLKGVQIQRKRQILGIVKELGYNAKSLPANPRGLSGPKLEVRAEYQKQFPDDYTDGKFKKAWEQLAAGRDIIIVK